MQEMTSTEQSLRLYVQMKINGTDSASLHSEDRRVPHFSKYKLPPD